MTAVMIGIDPHKGSHTAVAITAPEQPLAELRVRASAAQAGELVAWARAWPERTWAVEGAGGKQPPQNSGGIMISISTTLSVPPCGECPACRANRRRMRLQALRESMPLFGRWLSR